jgi:uncharacterized membrane protein YhaH (DUF805 family)
VSFSEAVKRGLTQTFSREGRAFRAEYWWFSLFSIICYLAGLAPTIAGEVLVGALVWVLVIVPTLGVFVCGMHDTGRSGLVVVLVLDPVDRAHRAVRVPL